MVSFTESSLPAFLWYKPNSSSSSLSFDAGIGIRGEEEEHEVKQAGEGEKWG